MLTSVKDAAGKISCNTHFDCISLYVDEIESLVFINFYFYC